MWHLITLPNTILLSNKEGTVRVIIVPFSFFGLRIELGRWTETFSSISPPVMNDLSQMAIEPLQLANVYLICRES